MGSANFAAYLFANRSLAPALIDAADGREVTDLTTTVGQAAAWLESAGLKPGDRLVLISTLSLDCAVAYLAGLWAGLTVVAVPDAVAAEISRTVEARAIWTPKDPAKLGWGTDALVFTGMPQADGACDVADRQVDDPALLVATSGSSRTTPDLVQLTHGNLVTNIGAVIKSQDLVVDDRALLFLPLHYCFGVSVFLSHLVVGGSVVLDRQFMFPQRVVDSAVAHSCTTLAGVTTHYRSLLEHTRFAETPLPSLRRQLQAGGPIDEDLASRLQAAHPGAGLYSMYGKTEATARISTLHPNDRAKFKGSVGKPVEGVEISLRPLDADTPDGEGELMIRGPSVAPCLWGQAGGVVDDDGWHATGDYAAIDADGFIWIKGRLSNFTKLSGERVSFEEVEDRVRWLKLAHDVAALTTRNVAGDEQLVILLEVGEGSGTPSEKPDDAAQQIRFALPRNWPIDCVQWVDALPRTSNGKLARRNLPSMISKEPGDA
ncbi:MAG: AMP-binding protein [Alphaproteobacteria bacterium]|nr:AMP-binding protein [Alphaproteobacteria bacterium SS10]